MVKCKKSDKPDHEDQRAAGLAADRAAVRSLAAGPDPLAALAVPVERNGAGRVDVRPPYRVPRR
jgi:hypothetical protein